MLISHTHKFIFTKTVKTASTSVEVYFERYCMDTRDLLEYEENSAAEYRDEYVSKAGIIGFRGEKAERIQKNPEWFHHMPADVIKSKIGNILWDNYFKFCVIRDPYEKLLSAFFHFGIARKKIEISSNNDLIIHFRNWLKSSDVIRADRDKYCIGKNYVMDDVVRFEDLHNDLRRICLKIGIPYLPNRLPRFKSKYRFANADIRNYYDKETENIVFDRFRFEFDFFSYNRLLF